MEALLFDVATAMNEKPNAVFSHTMARAGCGPVGISAGTWPRVSRT
jgi:hypothetical protein